MSGRMPRWWPNATARAMSPRMARRRTTSPWRANIPRLFGEPFGDHSAVPTLAVARLARRQCDGGAVRRWRGRGVRRLSPLPLPHDGRGGAAAAAGGLRRSAVGALARAYPKLDRAPRWLRAKTTLTEISLDSAMGYYGTVCKLARSGAARCSPGAARRGGGARPGGALRRADGGMRPGGFAAAGAVLRSAHLSAGRHPGQGGPHQHGGVAGGAAAAVDRSWWAGAWRCRPRPSCAAEWASGCCARPRRRCCRRPCCNAASGGFARISAGGSAPRRRRSARG